MVNLKYNKQQRILMLVENLPVPFDTRVWNEARTLTAAGFKVYIICPSNDLYRASYELLDGIEIFRYHPTPEVDSYFGYINEYLSFFVWHTWLTAKIFWTRGFDVIHACNPPDLIFLIALPYKLFCGVRFIFDHHDLCPELFLAKFRHKGLVFRALLQLERMTFALADVSIATNESYRSIAIHRGRMDPSRVFVVRSGPDLKRLQVPSPLSEAEVVAIKDGARHLVGYVGVMGRQEGLSYLLAAAAHLLHDHNRDDIHFVLIGNGPDLVRLRGEAVRLGVDRIVRFLGRVSDVDLVRTLSACDICVNPDEHNPMNDLSTMNKIMEYMALGKPIVQFGLREGQVTAGDASVYAAPNDALDFARHILQLLADPKRRARMSSFGRRRVEDELAWPHQARRLLAAYERIRELSAVSSNKQPNALHTIHRILVTRLGR